MDNKQKQIGNYRIIARIKVENREAAIGINTTDTGYKYGCWTCSPNGEMGSGYFSNSFDRTRKEMLKRVKIEKIKKA